ncbi:hypothetical protein NAP1_09042 [Erythrobacter sp. NAP1]|uniref:hypothetical protein n=1 Tax=Erythrobacter sp. NAP1 TaxID=237727 RepID=UPI0000685130|nr:hypothetical protein [Erythrobacter sp. NAP1]EAQ27727.1 hypothetical protein NAP1_09042 [Erythrobacter sp. NAP1]
MDMDLVLIFSFITVVVAITGISINAIVAKVYAHKKWAREHSLIGSKSSETVSQIAERTEMIEDRLKVLERLATDRGSLLSDEIEALRDDVKSRRQLENG